MFNVLAADSIRQSTSKLYWIGGMGSGFVRLMIVCVMVNVQWVANFIIKLSIILGFILILLNKHVLLRIAFISSRML